MKHHQSMILTALILSPIVGLVLFVGAWITIMAVPVFLLGSLVFGLPWCCYQSMRCYRETRSHRLAGGSPVLNRVLLDYLRTSQGSNAVYPYYIRRGKKLHLWIQFRGTPAVGNQVEWSTHVCAFDLVGVTERLEKKLAARAFDERMQSIPKMTITSRTRAQPSIAYSEQDQLFFQQLGMPTQQPPQWMTQR